VTDIEAGHFERPQTSTRDRTALHPRLVAWLGERLPAPKVSELAGPDTNGMSSETLLFDAEWDDNGFTRTQACAARLSPDPAAMPVFPAYDLERQFRVMRLVADRTAVPVPRTLWLEPGAEALGSPFFVMERVNGEVPSDIPPYTFDGWLLAASAEERDALQRASVHVLADLHGIDAPPAELAFLELDTPGDTALRRHVADQHRYYEWVAADGVRSPLIERALAWLEDKWPSETSPGLSWGDSRIGNILYRDFAPVAVLDWEMATIAPRELDLAWMIYLHRFFQDIAESVNFPGLPDFLRRDDVAATYESLTGHTPRDLEWFIAYAAVRHGIIMFRIGRRSILFGELEAPDDPDDMIFHRATIEAMLDGSYWAKL
jgi:aminoglycoside phosphotransferase (APT) family kinase protein